MKAEPQIRLSIEDYERIVEPLGKTKLDCLSSSEFLAAVKEEFLDFCQRHIDKAIPTVHKHDPQLTLTMWGHHMNSLFLTAKFLCRAAIRMLLSEKEQRKAILDLKVSSREQDAIIQNLQQEMAQVKVTMWHDCDEDDSLPGYAEDISRCHRALLLSYLLLLS